MLLGPALYALGDHLRLVHGAPADDIQGLFGWSGKAHALRRHAGGNCSEQFSLRIEDPDSLSGRNGRIEPASIVDSESIAAAHRENVRVPETSIRLNLECQDGPAIGCVERLLIRTELHAIGGLQSSLAFVSFPCGVM